MLMLSQCFLRLFSGLAPACSPSAQVKAAAAHAQRLIKRNERKRTLILSLWALPINFLSFLFPMRLVSHESTDPSCNESCCHLDLNGNADSWDYENAYKYRKLSCVQ